MEEINASQWVFRTCFFPLVLKTTKFAFIASVFITLPYLFKGSAKVVLGIPFVVFIGVLFGCFLSYLYRKLYPVTLTGEDIRSYDASGRYKSLTWRSVKELNEFSFFGLPYLEVTKVSGESIFLPQWIEKPDEFAARLSEFLPHERVKITAYFCPSK